MSKPLRHPPSGATAPPARVSLGDLLRQKGLASSPEPAASEAPAGDPVAALLRQAGKLVVRRERKGRGGKTVTLIEGLLAPGAANAPAGSSHGSALPAIEDLARRMKKALGCGAVVEGSILVLLGDLGERARGFLAEHGARNVVAGN